MQSIAELKAREEELEREWLWLVEALNTVARARAEQGDAGQRRVELRLQMAQHHRVG